MSTDEFEEGPLRNLLGYMPPSLSGIEIAPGVG